MTASIHFLLLYNTLSSYFNNRSSFQRLFPLKYNLGFQSEIPYSVRAAEMSAQGQSIFSFDPKGKVAAAYDALTKEVLTIEQQKSSRDAHCL